MKEYGPELIIESRFPYFQRKFKREIVYCIHKRYKFSLSNVHDSLRLLRSA